MARKLRIQYPGAIYHVMSRGDHLEEIFVDDYDRQRFLQTLEEACGKTDHRRKSCCPEHFRAAVGLLAQGAPDQTLDRAEVESRNNDDGGMDRETIMHGHSWALGSAITRSQPTTGLGNRTGNIKNLTI